jgi:hypothetical protein
MYIKRNIINYLKQFKMMDGSQYIPLVAIVAVSIFCYNYLTPDILPQYILPILEYCIPVFSAWWSIFILQDVLEEEGGEIFFTYPVKRWKLGLGRILLSFVLYVVCIIIIVGLFIIITKDYRFVGTFIQLFFQSLFFSALGFTAMVLTANTSWSLFIIIAYESTQIITTGNFFGLINIFNFNIKFLSVNEALISSFPTLIMALIMFIYSNNKFIKYDKYS